MHTYQHSRLPDDTLLHRFTAVVTRDNATTAELLSLLSEVDHRKLFRPAGYPSMFEYCVHELHMSEDVAYKRIRVARAARRFPAIYYGLADCRLHLSGLVLLAPYLKSGTANELLESAALKSRAEIELLLAQRFPQPDVPTVLRRIVTPGAGIDDTCAPAVNETAQPAHSTDAREVAPSCPEIPAELMEPLAPGPVVLSQVQNLADPMVPLVPGVAADGPPHTRLAPLSAERFALQVTLSRTAHDHLREAQALLGHSMPSGDISGILERALGEMVERLRKQKFAETARPRSQDSTAHSRHIPAAIRRAVAARDGGRCTFVSARGKRCDETSRLEYDHAIPVAFGGATTVANLRLRCRAHNQYAAECVYGAGFMAWKRMLARSQTSTERRAET